MKSLVKKLLTIAVENEDGFTVSLKNCEHVKSGWCIAYKDTQNSFGVKGLLKAIKHAKKANGIIGGWKDGDEFYFDSVMIVESKIDAIRLGKEHEQIAIFNLGTKEYLRLKKYL